MDIPFIRGEVAQQAHVAIPEGLYEEEYARSGFFGKYAHLYRAHPPVNWTRIEGNLRPRAYDLRHVMHERESTHQGHAVTPILGNRDVNIAMLTVERPMSWWYRNADGDEVLFVHKGRGRIETDFGPLEWEPGDYLVIPRGTVYRLLPKELTSFLVVESFSEVNFPDKGMLGQHALFDPAVIRVPTPEPRSTLTSSASGPVHHSGREYELRIKREGEMTSVFYPHCPIDTVGWKGTLTVMQLNVRDIRPVISERYHLPPSAHTTFVAQNFVICTFLPRGLETGDPAAVKVPFYHSNIDYDEVLFYHDGDFFSREGVSAGMMTFHPQGIHHGPQPKAVQRSVKAEKTNEIAVMIDTRFPLRPAEAIGRAEIQEYWKSWMK